MFCLICTVTQMSYQYQLTLLEIEKEKLTMERERLELEKEILAINKQHLLLEQKWLEALSQAKCTAATTLSKNQGEKFSF